MKASDKKFFGVLGQGTGTDKGFIYPLETADKCITKYIGLSLYPIVADGATLSTTSSDTFTATITSTNAAVHTLDPSVSTANKKDIMGGKAINDALQKLSLNFRAYDQWQYKAEYLSAQTVSLGVAAISSFAALTLY